MVQGVLQQELDGVLGDIGFKAHSRSQYTKTQKYKLRKTQG